MNNKKYSFHSERRDFLYILSGSLFLAAGLVFFLIPNKIVTGGIAGLAIVLHYISGAPTGLMILCLNIPLIIIGWHYLGRMFLVKTSVTIFLISFLTDFFIINLGFNRLTEHVMLATLYGGAAIGIGLGLIFRGNSSAGGWTVLARVITQKTHLTTGKILFSLDMVVILTAAIVFRNVELALWGLLTIFIASQIVDVILSGKPFSKMVYIESKNITLLGQQIHHQLGRRVALLPTRRLDSNENSELLMLVIEANQVNKLRDLVKQFDASASVIIADSRELLGKIFEKTPG